MYQTVITLQKAPFSSKNGYDIMGAVLSIADFVNAGMPWMLDALDL